MLLNRFQISWTKPCSSETRSFDLNESNLFSKKLQFMPKIFIKICSFSCTWRGMRVKVLLKVLILLHSGYFRKIEKIVAVCLIHKLSIFTFLKIFLDRTVERNINFTKTIRIDIFMLLENLDAIIPLPYLRVLLHCVYKYCR